MSPSAVMPRPVRRPWAFRELHFVALRIGVDFRQDSTDFLFFEVNQVIHQALCHGHMATEKREVEFGLRGEGVLHVGIEIQCHQAAAVVGTKGDFATGIGAHCAEAERSIAVWHTFTQNGVPEKHTGLCTAPGIVNDLSPKGFGIYIFLHHGRIAVDGELLMIGTALNGAMHELIIDAYTHIGSGDFSLFEFGVNEIFRFRMADSDAEHQGSTATVLRHLTGGVTVALHEGDNTR